MLTEWLKRVDDSALQLCLQEYVQSVLAQSACTHLHGDSVEFEEYTLIKVLESDGLWQGLEEVPASLALFAKHFLTRRSLYQSQGFWRNEGYRLEFGLMRIKLIHCGVKRIKGKALVSLCDQAIADFYGDLSVLHQATTESVNTLLAGFWRQYDAFTAADSAYKVLNVDPTSSWADIQKAYRKLAAMHHPDRGGDAEHFHLVKTAYDQLKVLQGNS